MSSIRFVNIIRGVQDLRYIALDEEGDLRPLEPDLGN